jgi:hypothetical protein
LASIPYPGAQDRAPLKKAAEEFAGFYGLEAQPPTESSPFVFHDGGHRVINAPATIYGELLENAADKSAFKELYESGQIQSNPPAYEPAELKKMRDRSSPGRSGSSSFVNYGRMPSAETHALLAEKSIRSGANPGDFELGKNAEFGLDTAIRRRISEQDLDFNQLAKVADQKFKQNYQTFFQGAGGYDPGLGFMPSPDLRNPRGVDAGDINVAQTRGKAYAQDLMRGYRDAVESGKYKPSRPVWNGATHAADLSDAAMSGVLEVGRGWSDEGIFPYGDKINQLSNPPARLPGPPDDLEMDVDIANRARRQRALNRVRGAIRTGANVTTDIAGSVPLFDPEFRSAIERGDMGEAVKRVGIDYAVGTATAPVVGMAAGTLQRLAPQVAARALPAVAGATRIGNPVAVVSQIGGDSRQSQAQVVAAQQAAERQLNRAREARQRGGRWGVGPLRLPELGISEAGGLLFGGNKSGRQVGTRATLGGKPVVWTGDNYGWHSPASANKIGVR